MDRLKRDDIILIVESLTEGVLLIEPKGRITYANAAALAMHGVDSFEGLGGTVDVYRDRFVLRYRNNHLIKPEKTIFENVLAGKTFDQVIVEVERKDDPDRSWTHRLRSMVIPDEKGRPEFIVLIVADVSDQFEAEERFNKAFSSNPAPAVICRLADQRFLRMNDGFEELTGFRRKDFVDRTLADIDILAGAQRRQAALQSLEAAETIPQMEAALPTRDGGTRLVILAGQAIELDDEGCMLFTFADLEPRKLAEAELQDSQERSDKIFRLAPVPITLSCLDTGELVDVNEAFCTATGYEASDVIGSKISDLDLWADRKVHDRFRRELKRQGSIRGFEALMREKDGSEFDALVSAETVRILGERYDVCSFEDISARKRSEAELMRAIDSVMSDASWFGQAVVERLSALKAPRKPEQASLEIAQLTARQKEVLGHLCQGLNDAEIAARLSLSPNTVHNHVSALFQKIGVNRRSAAVAWARDRGFGEELQSKRSIRRGKRGS